MECKGTVRTMPLIFFVPVPCSRLRYVRGILCQTLKLRLNLGQQVNCKCTSEFDTCIMIANPHSFSAHPDSEAKIDFTCKTKVHF